MNIEKIEGIGPKYAQKLMEQSIRSTDALLKAAANRKGREDLAAKTGISEKLILEWVNRADLMRVKGVGEEYSDLLEAAGVDTVRELRNRRADKLHKALAETNAAKRLVRRVPSLVEVEHWIENAKKLAPKVTY
jgi:predicted flap endonuclease-1-like 5' DNA nuclease